MKSALLVLTTLAILSLSFLLYPTPPPPRPAPRIAPPPAILADILTTYTTLATRVLDPPHYPDEAALFSSLVSNLTQLWDALPDYSDLPDIAEIVRQTHRHTTNVRKDLLASPHYTLHSLSDAHTRSLAQPWLSPPVSLLLDAVQRIGAHSPAVLEGAVAAIQRGVPDLALDLLRLWVDAAKPALGVSGGVSRQRVGQLVRVALVYGDGGVVEGVRELLEEVGVWEGVCVGREKEVDEWGRAMCDDRLSLGHVGRGNECPFDVVDVGVMDGTRFERDYVALGRPVKVQMDVGEMRTRQVWTREGLEVDGGGRREVDVGQVPYPSVFGLEGGRVSVSRFLRYLERVDPDAEEPPLYAFDAGGRIDPDAVRADVPGWVTDVWGEGANVQFFLGGKGSGAPLHSHCDAVNVVAWGERVWILVPPKDMVEGRGGGGYSKVPPRDWIQSLLSGEQGEEKEEVYVCRQRGGEGMYVPRGWGHATLNLGFNVGFAVEYDTC